MDAPTDNQPSMPMPTPATPIATDPAPIQPMVPVSGAPMPAASPAQAASSSAATGQTPAVAADNDMIEREWILKAKQIIATTAHDPFEQSRQLAALKADYIQKRYNKTVKLSE